MTIILKQVERFNLPSKIFISKNSFLAVQTLQDKCYSRNKLNNKIK